MFSVAFLDGVIAFQTSCLHVAEVTSITSQSDSWKAVPSCLVEHNTALCFFHETMCSSADLEEPCKHLKKKKEKKKSSSEASFKYFDHRTKEVNS